MEQKELLAVAEKFCVEGTSVDARPYGEGHINRTYLLTTDKKRYIMQCMNTRVFPDSEGLMRNIVAVTEHLRSRGVETLEVIPTKAGKSYLSGEKKWRVYAFIEGTVTYQIAPDERVFGLSGYAFGQFQNYLADFDASVLTEAIPHFHDTPKRYRDFTRALEEDKLGRSKSCQSEIAFVRSHASTYSRIAEGLERGEIPLRVTHNDTKLNNVLMDAETNEPRAVIDLDTVMPGSLLYDFGDSIRFGATTAAEDERDLSLVEFSLPRFRAYAEGYFKAARASVTAEEAELLPYGAYLMTAECGMRFLADYLEGDVYFAIKSPDHNLVRARTQLKLASQMEKNFSRMHDIIASLL